MSKPKIKWTIVGKDTSKPIDGEQWHPAPDVPAARLAIQLWIRDNMPKFENVPYWRHNEGINRTRIDFGSKERFAVIVREG